MSVKSNRNALDLLTDDVPEVLVPGTADCGALPAVDAFELPAGPALEDEVLEPVTVPEAEPVDEPALADDVEPSVRLRRYFLRLA